MAHQRQPSTAPGGTHALSLKVLRLTRPGLATQTPLPLTSFGNGLDVPPEASLAYPGADARSTFPLAPLLTLPAAFGAAYVGETFTCTLCANNEVREDEGRSVSGVKIVAELQTPSNPAGTALELTSAEDIADGSELRPGETLQRTLSHDLKEEGQHVLAVTVTYTETHLGQDGAPADRIRTFRKLYQFVAQQLIAVRSKITERKQRAKETDAGRSFILEAQIENVGEASVVLEKVRTIEKEGIIGKALNGEEAVVLKAGDIEQVMFMLKEERKKEGEEGLGRVPLAQLSVVWRSAMGERGSLTTGWLASRAR